MGTRAKLGIKAVIGVVLGAVALLLIVPIPIDIEAPALEIRYADPSHLEERTVYIRGWFSLNAILGWHSFRGTIRVSGHPVTDNALLSTPLRLYPWPAERWSLWESRHEMLIYVDPKNLVPISGTKLTVPKHVVFGAIFTTPFFRQTMIQVNSDEGQSPNDFRAVVLNATTREEALASVRRHIYRFPRQ